MSENTTFINEAMERVRKAHHSSLPKIEESWNRYFLKSAGYGVALLGTIACLASEIEGIEMPPQGAVEWGVTALETVALVCSAGKFSFNALGVYITARLIQDESFTEV